MSTSIVIPKKHSTVEKCVAHILSNPERAAFQSELKRIVYSKSWRFVVKRELSLMDRLTLEQLDEKLLIITPTRNPKTGKKNEIMYQINPEVEIHIMPKYYLITTRGDKPT